MGVVGEGSRQSLEAQAGQPLPGTQLSRCQGPTIHCSVQAVVRVLMELSLVCSLIHTQVGTGLAKASRRTPPPQKDAEGPSQTTMKAGMGTQQ